MLASSWNHCFLWSIYWNGQVVLKLWLKSQHLLLKKKSKHNRDSPNEGEEIKPNINQNYTEIITIQKEVKVKMSQWHQKVLCNLADWQQSEKFSCQDCNSWTSLTSLILLVRCCQATNFWFQQGIQGSRICQN